VRVDHFAVIPVDGGRAIATRDGMLPRIQGEWPDTADMRDALSDFGRPLYLRVAAHVQVAPDRIMRLRMFDAGEGDGVPLAEADPTALVPEPLRPALERTLAELRGLAPIPAARPPWSRPGWHAEAEAWFGAPLEQFRIWPLSAVLRAGDAWFKAVFPLFHHEPAVTEAIGRPRVLRSDHERGWMVVEHVEGKEASDHHGAFRAIARIHRDWTERTNEALALGAHDRRAPSSVPHTLVHGDFHQWNVIGSTIIDWSDAAVANPLLDLNYYLLNLDDTQRAPLLETYSETYGEDVAAFTDACEAEAYEYVARSYAGITAACAPDDRWWFADEEERWLRRARDVRAGRRPSRDT
jgi:hypothetical protein